MIYLDCAATTLQKPPAVVRAAAWAVGRLATPGRGGHPAAAQAAALAFRCREEAAALFGVADPERVIFTANATHALNIAIRSLVPPGGRVVLSGWEHNAVTRPLAALDAKLQAGDLAGLEESLTAWRKANSAAAQTLFTRNITVNAILQDAASRAQRAGILFQASAPVPEELPFPDEDLCALLMNLLDNALEGAERTPAGQRRSIHFKMRLSNGFLSVLCENTFDGRLSVGADGSLHTTKEDAESHGFGLPQIRNVAKKYGSMLDIRYTASLFTVQAALQIPKAARRKTAM